MAVIPPRRGEELTPSGRATTRFSDFLENVTETTNSNESTISTATQTENLQAIVFALQERIGSGDDLTCDETGFTIDSTKLSIDMTEA